MNWKGYVKLYPSLWFLLLNIKHTIEKKRETYFSMVKILRTKISGVLVSLEQLFGCTIVQWIYFEFWNWDLYIDR